eukprot:GHVU01042009.1.p1 GENE.GHVU01042009.1~~GHVU01042009.1.p1  ORF type:complete len:530 (-),score=96.40 GHVU01042009.1:109-1698(-)
MSRIVGMMPFTECALHVVVLYVCIYLCVMNGCVCVRACVCVRTSLVVCAHAPPRTCLVESNNRSSESSSSGAMDPCADALRGVLRAPAPQAVRPPNAPPPTPPTHGGGGGGGGESSSPAALQTADYSESAALNALRTCRVLVVGAGGLGCELLKGLVMCGFRNIEVVDMDTIDESNLNRQFLFRDGDIGKSKAEVAARAVNEGIGERWGAHVTSHVGKIEDMEEKDKKFYRNFDIVVSGLDSVEARVWLSNKLLSLADEKPSKVIPLVDGGLEGLLGQTRVLWPYSGPCFSCIVLDMPLKKKYPMCTLANVPRLPEHCIAYAMEKLWGEEHPDVDLDVDNPKHLEWVCERAQARAKVFNIVGVTPDLTAGVVKNIVPNVAFINCVTASHQVNEAFKLVTRCAPAIDNHFFFNGVTCYSAVARYDRNPNCTACVLSRRDGVVSVADVSIDDTLETLVHALQAKLPDPAVKEVKYNDLRLWMAKPGLLAATFAKNLPQPLCGMITSADPSAELTVELVNGSVYVVNLESGE